MQRSVPRSFAQAGDIRADDRRPAGHGLQRGETESLISAGKNKGQSSAVQRRQIALPDGSGKPYPVRQTQCFDPPPRFRISGVFLSRQHQTRCAAQSRKGIDQRRQIFMRLVASHIKQIGFGQSIGRSHRIHFAFGAREKAFADSPGYFYQSGGFQA